jgi:glutamine amidotransferase PdxT
MLGDKALHEKEGGQPLIGGLSVVVDRNHFGSQLRVSVFHSVWLSAPLPSSTPTWSRREEVE